MFIKASSEFTDNERVCSLTHDVNKNILKLQICRSGKYVARGWAEQNFKKLLQPRYCFLFFKHICQFCLMRRTLNNVRRLAGKRRVFNAFNLDRKMFKMLVAVSDRYRVKR